MRHILAIAAAMALAACSSTPINPAAQDTAPEKEYRTGSRIPVRDSAAASSPAKTLDPSALGPSVPIRTN